MAAMPTKENMPYPSLTPITAITFHSFTRLNRELYSNSKSVSSNRGNGALGHAYIVLGQEAYTARAGVPFAPPGNPGQLPNMENGTAVQIGALTAHHRVNQEEYQRYQITDNILKTQFIERVPERYYSSLIDRIEGISQHSLFDILTHVRTQHVTITDNQLRENAAALEAPWAPEDTMEPLWQRTQDISAFAIAGGSPIDDVTRIRTTKKVLQDIGNGVFNRAIEQWDDKADADKTWANFQTHFERANHRRREDMTATDAGLGGGHAANAAVNIPAPGGNPAPAPGVVTGRSYCWTHGYCLGSNHTSLTCLHKAAGHREDATIVNMFGGNNTIARNRDQPLVYRHPPRNGNGTSNTPTPST
jgi:hypothetical protein